MAQTVHVSAALLAAAANVLEAVPTAHAAALAADLRAAAGEATQAERTEGMTERMAGALAAVAA